MVVPALCGSCGAAAFVFLVGVATRSKQVISHTVFMNQF